jgi:HlyD family secretion protein
MAAHATDVPIERRKRSILMRALAAAVVAAGVFLLLASWWRGANALTVDRASVVTSKVERGTLRHEVRGLGTLVAERSRIVAAETVGRVESIRVRAGEAAQPSTTLIVLSNPEIEQKSADAAAALRMAEAEMAVLRAQLSGELMRLRAELAQIEGDAEEAHARAKVLAELSRQGLASSTDLQYANVRAQSLGRRLALQKSRIAEAELAVEAQLAAKRAATEQARTRDELAKRELRSLEVKAAIEGVVQDITVQPGQHVAVGETLARLADVATSMIARVQIQPSHARNIASGMPARIDTHSGIVAGRVTRIDPAVRDGAVTVDIALTAPLPPGVRPDSSVEGTILIGKIDDVLLIRRPANVEEHSTVELFRLEDESSAKRTRVLLGRGSDSVIEVVRGLAAGDEIIISDASAWQSYNRIRIR